MKQGLPSLNVLMVFDVAARTLSFKSAAEELHITPPAVSHQIRVLEKELGVTLFKRMNRSVELSKEGKEYYSEIAPALAQLRQATSQLQTPTNPGVFRIISIPFLTNSLLIPNIQQFMDIHPSMQVSIESTLKGVGFSDRDTVIAIRRQRGHEREIHYEDLSRILISPVCSQSYMEKYGPIKLEDIAQHRLVKMYSDQDAWPSWSRVWLANLTGADELIVDNYQGVLDAIKQDLGVAMGYFPVLQASQESKPIVPVWPDRLSEYGSIYLAYRKTDEHKAVISDFKNWLLSLFEVL